MGRKKNELTREVRDRLRCAAIMTAHAKVSLNEASRKMGLGEATLGQNVGKHRPSWKRELALAEKAIRLCGNAEDSDDAPRMKSKTRRQLREAALLVANGCTFREASRKLRQPETWLIDLISDYPDVWRYEAFRAGIVEDIWGPEFKGIWIRTRRNMVRAAVIFAGCNDYALTGRRMGITGVAVMNYSRNHGDLWKSLLNEARRKLGIPEGQKQRARMVEAETGKPIKRRPDKAGALADYKKRKGSRRRGGRPESPAQAVILREFPTLQGQKLVNVINRECSAAIGAGKMKRMTQAGLRGLMKRMRRKGLLPSLSSVTKP